MISLLLFIIFCTVMIVTFRICRWMAFFMLNVFLIWLTCGLWVPVLLIFFLWKALKKD